MTVGMANVPTANGHSVPGVYMLCGSRWMLMDERTARETRPRVVRLSKCG